MDALARELRHAFRSLRRSPGFTAVVVVTLGLGLGATTALFSVLYQVLLEPLPYEDPGTLARVHATAPGPRGAGIDTLNWSHPKLVSLRRAEPPFRGLAAYRSFSGNLTGGDVPERVRGELVSPGYFRLLGARSLHGRTFGPEEMSEDEAVPLAVLSHGLWLRRFGGDPGVVGRRLTLDGVQLTVVGVMPRNFEGLAGPTEVWVPLGMARSLYYAQALEERFNHWLRVVGRVDPGLEPAAVEAGTREAARQVAEEIGGPVDPDDVGAAVLPLEELRATAPLRTSLLVLLGAVGFVLLIACLNVSNLLLARTTARGRELAVRAALGAGRARILRQLVVEGLVLAAAGGGLALLAARWILDGVRAVAPASATWWGAGGLGGAGFDVHVAAVALVGALVVALGAGLGLLPGLRVAGMDPADVLRGTGRGVRPHGSSTLVGRRPWRVSVLVQTALAVVLLVGAGLMVRSQLRLQAADPGIRPEGLVTFRIEPSSDRSPEELASFKVALAGRLEAVPGVTGATEGQCTPLSGGCSVSVLTRIEGEVEFEEGERPVVGVHRVLPGHFEVLGTPILSGRDFRSSDRIGTGKVVLVNRAFARRFLPGAEPLGRRLHVAQSYFRGDSAAAIVGVVGDVAYGAPGDPVRPAVYVPSLQSPWAAGTWIVRSDVEPSTVVPAVRRAVLDVDADLPIFDVATMEERVAEATATTRFAAGLLTGFALLAGLLAAVGIYGVVAWVVGRRVRELGVRAALGAERRDLLRLAMREGLTPALGGLGLGLLVALGLTRSFRSLLFEIGSTDPATYAAVAVGLAGVCCLACFLPARRAVDLDPMTVLREE